MVRFWIPRLPILVLALSLTVTPASRAALSAQAGSGALDPTFSENGYFGFGCGAWVPFPMPPVCDIPVNAMVVQPDGRFVLAGMHGKLGVGGAFHLRRYTADGVRDLTFANVPADFSPGRDEVFGMALQPDGKIVVAGAVNGQSTTDFAVARYLPDGTLDPDFGAGGKVLTTMGVEHAAANAVVIQPDGKVVVAGTTQLLPQAPGMPALVRYLPNGQLDRGFGSGGRAYSPFITTAGAMELALKADGRLVVGVSVGGTNLGEIPRGFGVLQFLPNGTADVSFGVAGRAVVRSPNFGFANAMVVQDDGRIIVGGSAGSALDSFILFALVGWTEDGVLDQGFGAGGAVFTPFPSGVRVIQALAVQADGKLIAGGHAGLNFGLARYLPNGALDRTFGFGGRVITSFIDTNAVLTALVIQPDGKIVAAGNAYRTGGGPTPAMARYMP
jgi:uncharacterized delta-60 repeat protein